MRCAIVCLVLVAGCATTPADLKKMSTAEVCYIGMVEPEKKAMTDAEIQSRKEDCEKHTAEIDKINDQEMRASRIGGAVGDATPKAAGMTGGGSGMGRGY